MKFFNIKNVSKILFLIPLISVNSFTSFKVHYDDLDISFGGKFKEETFFARNAHLLNSRNEMDKVWYMQHVLDLNFQAIYGVERYGHEAAEFYMNLRNKGRWGSVASIAVTSRSFIKVADYTTPAHQHFLGKHIIWLREAWLKLSMNALFDSELKTKHFLMLGSFPFALGRGIALGDAFAVNPGFLGFYTDDVVDQYAFGGRLFGDFVKDRLTYDFYSAVLKNEYDSFKKTSEKIRAQYLGDCDWLPGRIDPFRGAGDVNYVVAGRLNWTVFNSQKYGQIVAQSYALYNRDPEQRVEFEADANSKLGTVGLNVEWAGSKFEGGFDMAFNMGHQKVVALDRNRIDLRNDNGIATFYYTKVLTDPDDTSSYAPVTSANKSAVNSATISLYENGRQVPGATLYNSIDRFRPAYKNKYRGWMFVADGAYWFKNNVFNFAGTVGVASGDESPNKNLNDPNDAQVDGEYKGFIGLQEVYSGKRVNSVYVLGLRRLPRPLSVPRIGGVSGQFAVTVDAFTNLAFGGIGAHWTPNTVHRWNFNPNLLWYWQEHPTKAYNLATNQSSQCFARKFLGIEANIFVDFILLNNVKGFITMSGFVPGEHYDDIKGKPLTSAQSNFIDRLNRTGYNENPEPLLGTDNVFSLNAGLEYRF